MTLGSLPKTNAQILIVILGVATNYKGDERRFHEFIADVNFTWIVEFLAEVLPSSG
jgi:hypothetical protein